MPQPAWILVFFGLLMAALLWLFAPAAGWLGRLACDIVVERGDFRFFSLDDQHLLSLLLTGIAWLIRYLFA